MVLSFMMTGVFSILIVLLSQVYYAKADWSYTGKNGPEFWPQLYKNCGGKHQSSASLRSSQAHVSKFDSFIFVNYDFLPSKLTLRNNGVAAVLKMSHPSNVPSIVRGGGLTGEYIFLQAVFHWGETADVGSEHFINDKQYPMELHLVHYNRQYGSIQEAIRHSDGVAILAILFKRSLLDNPSLIHITDSLAKIIKCGTHYDFYASTSLLDLLPNDRVSYFRYNGSLTTPLCEEVVIWTVFTDPLEISERQLNMFRKLLAENGRPIGNNFRPLQELNGRKVYLNKEPKKYTIYCDLPIVCPLIGNIAGFLGYL